MGTVFRELHFLGPLMRNRDAKTNVEKVDESLCTHCGKCCYKKVIIGRTVFITPFPCEFLDTDTNLCTIYDRRHELNPLCLSVPEGMKVNAFPSDCPYVPLHAPRKYKPAMEKVDWDWDDFDDLADDLDVPDEIREKVRARGRNAPPMYIEAFARIEAQRQAQSQIFGSGELNVVDMRTQLPEQAPSLRELAQLRSGSAQEPKTKKSQ